MRLLIIQPKPPGVSETFLRAPAEYLPYKVQTLYATRGGDNPNTPFLDKKVTSWLWRKSYFMLTGGRYWCDSPLSQLGRQMEPLPDLVLAQYGPTGARIAPLCRRLGVPLVVHFHGRDASEYATLRRNKTRYLEMAQYAGAVIAVSRKMADQLAGIGIPREKLRWNPCGVDIANFHGADPGTAPPLFVAVGGFVEKKAPHHTLEAFSSVLREVPSAKLRMIGAGLLLPRCRNLADKLGIAQSVDFLGAQPHEVVVEEMKKARCFLQHSVVAPDGDSEGTPVAVLEAGACGLPVVSTHHAGIPDVVLHEETGFLVQEHDVASMAQHMTSLARDSELAAKLGRAGQERIRSEFSMERHISRLSRILEDAVDPNAGCWPQPTKCQRTSSREPFRKS